MVVKFDEQQQKAQVSLKAEELFAITDRWEQEQGSNRSFFWRPEFAAYMIEGTPGHPYGDGQDQRQIFAHFATVEKNMRNRRKEIEQLLAPDEALLSITSFPRLGSPDFCFPPQKVDPINSLIGSIFFPDDCVFGGHPRFKTLASNIRTRRQRKVAINIPLFKDQNTHEPFVEKFEHFHPESDEASKPDHVYMDAMGFGMGCCCLQVTFQASDLNEARSLYDQLAPLCPLMMALSAASPIQRGYLTDRDCRWAIVSQSVDDRTKEELGELPMRACERAESPRIDGHRLNAELFANARKGQHVAYNPVRTCSCGSTHYRINKSRYDSIDSYISKQGEKYNDIPITYNVDYFSEMVSAGVDPLIARHIAHLFIRDPISVYREKLHQNDETESDHFENIQSTNWQTMRFKPPPPNSEIGWRVEFRPMEVQLTEFENAAYVTFIVLLTRVILTYRLNLLIPISKVDENMKEAQKRDAVNRCKFWFRKEIITVQSPPEAATCVEATGCSSGHLREKDSCEASTPTETPVQVDESCILMSLDEIINGKGNEFPGLVPLLRSYLVSIELDAETHCCLQQYLNLIANRAAGKCLTAAKWIRNFVRQHADYKQDSVVDPKINFDLLQLIRRITNGKESAPELLGDAGVRVVQGSSSSA